MSDDKRTQDEAVDRELEGVPEEFLDNGTEDSGQDEAESDPDKSEQQGAISSLRADLDAAKQDALYARAETQNVRRRMEKDIADARAYAATGFARDILSVADNLARGIDAIPEDLREDSKFKGLVQGIQATQRELDKVFAANGITRIASIGLPLDPNLHQAMLEVPTQEAEPGTITQEMQAGYMIRDRLLRPAMVGVAKSPA